MISFIDWMDQKGFLAKDVWDIEAGKWIHDAPLQLFPFQRDILAAAFTPDENGVFPYTDIVYSTIKKSGKTTIEAALMAWAGEESLDGSEIYAIANDLDQAVGRGFTDLEYHTIRKLGISAARNRIVYPNHTIVQAIAQHYASAAGSRPFLSVFDELWAYISERSRRMWAEMTPPPTVENSMRVTVTYAGFENESDQLLEMYNLCFKKENGQYVSGEPVPGLEHIVDSWGEPVCRRSGRTFIYWDTVARMPWQTEAYYEDQMRTLRPADFMRMHRNRWVSANEQFIPMELYDKAVDKNIRPLTIDVDHPYKNSPIVLAVDIGIKHDSSAVVGTYYDFGRKKVGQACHAIFKPPKGGQLDIEATVENYVIRLFSTYNIIAVLYDPYQFARSSVTLIRKGIPMVEFPQSPGNMTAATQTFYEALTSGAFETYQSEEMRDHIRYASVDVNQRGSRLIKGKNAKYQIDAAIALAMSIHWSVRFGGVDYSEPVVIENPFTDSEVIPRYSAEQMQLPEELRTYDD